MLLNDFSDLSDFFVVFFDQVLKTCCSQLGQQIDPKLICVALLPATQGFLPHLDQSSLIYLNLHVTRKRDVASQVELKKLLELVFEVFGFRGVLTRVVVEDLCQCELQLCGIHNFTRILPLVKLWIEKVDVSAVD